MSCTVAVMILNHSGPRVTPMGQQLQSTSRPHLPPLHFEIKDPWWIKAESVPALICAIRSAVSKRSTKRSAT